MAIRWMFFLSLATILISCAAQQEGADAEAEAESYVLALDSTNFSEALSKHPFMFVQFYSPRCGRCKHFAPEYEKAAASLKNHDPPIILAKVDVNEQSNKGLAREYEVRSYPTLKIIQNGGENIETYEGPHEANGIVEYLKNREANGILEYLKKQVVEEQAQEQAEEKVESQVLTLDSTKEQTEAEVESYVLTLDSTNFSEALTKHPFMVVKFYAPWCGHCKRLAPEYEKAATSLKNHDPPIILAKVDANEKSNKALAGKYEVRGYPTLKIIWNGGENIENYEGPREAYGIVEYLKKKVVETQVEVEAQAQAQVEAQAQAQVEVETKSEAGVESYVLTLDSTNFSEALSTHPFMVVKFYAPW